MLVAQVCGLRARELVHVIGDAHVYATHERALREQLLRAPRPFPRLRVAARADITAFTLDDFTLEGYQPHAHIHMQMAL